MPTPSNPSDIERRRGLLFGVLAYAAWGVIPLYWRLLHEVDPVEVLAHRTVWGLVTFGGLVLALGVGPAVRRAATPRLLLVLGASGALLFVNWGIFIHAIVTNQLLQASLGYFINPLVNVVLGMVFLRERLRPVQWVAVALAGTGVSLMALQAGGVPWIALALASSFGLYGLVRKVAPVDALAGSFLETALLAPFGFLYLVVLGATGRGHLGHGSASLQALLIATGVVTALPLVWFTAAARRLPLSTVGFLQYLAPTGQLLTAVLVFDEPFSTESAVAFGFIWAGLVAFSVDLLRGRDRTLYPRGP